jgi:hypothetical protein
MANLPFDARPGEVHRGDDGLLYRLGWTLLPGQEARFAAAGDLASPECAAESRFGLIDLFAIAAEVDATARTRRDGWTFDRRRDCLRQLASGAGMGAAARAVGMTRQSLRKLCRRAPVFAAALERLLGPPQLPPQPQSRYRRALEGRLVPIYAGSRLVGTRRDFSDRLAIAELVRAERRGGAAGTFRGDEGPCA